MPVMMATFAVAGLLSACATTAPTAQNTAIPARTLSDKVVDESIERTIAKNIPSIAGLESARHVRVMADSFYGEVLLTGEVPNETVKTDVENMVKSLRNVKQVYNYLTVSPTAKSPSHTTHENYLKSKIRAKILTHQANSPQYKMVLRSDVVYLMGYASADQQSSVVQAVDSTMGIQKLILLNTLVDETVVQNSGDVAVSSASQAPIVRMEDTPVSDYVRLYNNTTSP